MCLLHKRTNKPQKALIFDLFKKSKKAMTHGNEHANFYEGPYIKFDTESAKSNIGDDEKSPKLTHGPLC